jgi:hypothetical protein
MDYWLSPRWHRSSNNKVTTMQGVCVCVWSPSLYGYKTFRRAEGRGQCEGRHKVLHNNLHCVPVLLLRVCMTTWRKSGDTAGGHWATEKASWVLSSTRGDTNRQTLGWQPIAGVLQLPVLCSCFSLHNKPTAKICKGNTSMSAVMRTQTYFKKQCKTPL